MNNDVLCMVRRSNFSRRTGESRYPAKEMEPSISVLQIVCFEVFDSAMDAIRRGKCFKEWRRSWELLDTGFRRYDERIYNMQPKMLVNTLICNWTFDEVSCSSSHP